VHSRDAFEIRLGVREKLTVGGVVRALHADDFGGERMSVHLHVSEKLELCRRRPHEKDLSAAFECLRHLVEEAFVVFGMRLDALWPPRVLVVDVMGRNHDFFVRLFRKHSANAGFFVIDPNSYVLGHRGSSARLLAALV
jgi:hypothetical protein